MPKKADKVSLSLKAKKLCPHCGHDNFRAVVPPKKILGIFSGGQEFVCAKCNGTFKKANLVKVNQKEKHFFEQSGSKHRR